MAKSLDAPQDLQVDPPNFNQLEPVQPSRASAANGDPWKHRSKNMLCSTCMFFVRKQAENSLGRLGRCRRHAPSMNGYPVVYENDWCGDHKIDENKV